MNFDFSEDLNLLREQARRFLGERCTPRTVRAVFEGEQAYDRALWSEVSRLGWTGCAIPEAYGGLGLGHEALCVIAEEMGRAIAPLPFGSSVFLAAEAILLYGTEAQKQAWLPALAAGESIGAFALAEGPGNPRAAGIATRLESGRLHGVKWPVLDGAAADCALVVAVEPSGALALVRVALDAPGVRRTTLQTLDPARPQVRIEFDCAPAERLGDAPLAWADVERLLDRAAVPTAFEQIGGAAACLEMATAYAKERFAFGRPIGSFQAIKHKLADVFVAIEIARSNAYYGAWALDTDAPELAAAAAAARIGATQAFHLASKENIQVHGGMGFTWEMDCHLYYRRAKVLSAALGSPAHWKERLVRQYEARVQPQLRSQPAAAGVAPAADAAPCACAIDDAAPPGTRTTADGAAALASGASASSTGRLDATRARTH
ncbi:MAG TPA: acyl-CoA dehydrogenase family protein [Quisquiliibacterium sp.]|nr:acyl-CoA dehydrogenase family protein [Quisquiliibacterium sp.]